MSDATDVRQLDDDDAAARVHSVGHQTPAGNLFGCMNAWRVEVPLPNRTGLSPLGDD
jgi:hypothetical protein